MSDDGRDDGPDPSMRAVAKGMGDPDGVADRLADERLHVTFNDDETREIMGIAAAVEDCLRAAGHELPKDPMRGLLAAGRWWFRFYAAACAETVRKPLDETLH